MSFKEKNTLGVSASNKDYLCNPLLTLAQKLQINSLNTKLKTLHYNMFNVFNSCSVKCFQCPRGMSFLVR